MTPEEMRHAVLQQLASLQRAGIQQLPKVTIPVSAWTYDDAPESPAASTSPPATDHPPVQTPAHSPASSQPTSPNLTTPTPVRPTAAAPPPTTSAAPTPTPAPPPAAKVPPRPAAPRPTPAARPLPPPLGSQSSAAPLSTDERRMALEVIQNEVKACQRCSQLVANRTQTVFGVGTLTPRLCFFGEAPGADEDRTGEPFVGRAGQLLNKMIDAMGLKREEVYILNVLKCRPPDNRPPQDDEIENCRGFYTRQFEILQPEFICCLGASAAKALLHTGFSLGKMRGRFYDAHGAKTIVTYHPSYLLRTPAAKKDAWEDLQMLMREMGLPLSKNDPS